VTTIAPAGVDELVAYVSELAEDVFAAVTDLRKAVERMAEPLTRRELKTLEFPVRRALASPGDAIVGAGFVASPDALTDAGHWLEWWAVDEDRTQATRLVFETDPAAVAFRDYTQLPWFAVPKATGGRHITGPYVDYLCTDEYTLTFTVPVRTGAAAAFAGVVGADVHVRHLERLLLPRLRAQPAATALVNAEGRIVVGATAGLVTGALLRDVHYRSTLYRCPDLPLGVITRS